MISRKSCSYCCFAAARRILRCQNRCCCIFVQSSDIAAIRPSFVLVLALRGLRPLLKQKMGLLLKKHQSLCLCYTVAHFLLLLYHHVILVHLSLHHVIISLLYHYITSSYDGIIPPVLSLFFFDEWLTPFEK